jgi:hypothetical protein
MATSPNIKAVVQRISELSSVQEWISARPKTDF